jgi:hypothetical protein
LTHFRLTPLGAFILGRTNDYAPQRSGEKHLVVRRDKEKAFRKALASIGYGMPFS